MKSAIESCEKEIEFEIYSTGMNDENLSETEESRFSISHFKGYIESEKLGSFLATADDLIASEILAEEIIKKTSPEDILK